MKPSEIAPEVDLLHTIWLRNRRQHRAQMWWKYFDIFLRRVRQQSRTKRFDQRALQALRDLLPKFWRAMHGALASGAFLTIVFAVMASVAKLSNIMGINARIKPKLAVPVPTSSEDLGQIVDATVPSAASAANVKSASSTRKSKGASAIDDIFKPALKKKKKKPKRDAIDDIFG